MSGSSSPLNRQGEFPFSFAGRSPLFGAHSPAKTAVAPKLRIPNAHSATLNRVPTLKAPLKVYDAERRLIGEARVVDSQPPSPQVAMVASQVQAQVEIVTTYVASPVSFSGWTVAG